MAVLEIQLSNNPKISRGNTETISDLQSKNNFVITFSPADYQLNETWKVCNLDAVYVHLKQLNVLE